MEKIDQLWVKRRGEFWQIASRYLKLLGNSGFMFSLYILILGGGVYYQRWVSGLPDSFPTEWVLTIVFAILVFRTPIRTFLDPADLVFLLPLEKKLESYFKKSLVYNGILQSISIVFTWAVSLPLYLHTVSSDMMNAVILLVLLLVLKAWNVDAVWQEYYVLKSISYDIFRGLLTLFFIAAILFKFPWFLLLIIILVMLLNTIFVYHPLSKQHLLKWEKVLASEERQMNKFLRFANLITDVPRMQQRMKPRRWLTGLTEVYPYGKKAVFKKFFLKTFIRSGEYFGVWVRLVIIGLVIMAFLPKGWTTIILALVFTYLTAIQIVTLWKEHLVGPTTMFLLPLNDIKNGFLSVLLAILISQIVIFSIAALILSGSLFVTGMTFLCGLVLCFGFTFGYVKIKL